MLETSGPKVPHLRCVPTPSEEVSQITISLLIDQNWLRKARGVQVLDFQMLTGSGLIDTLTWVTDIPEIHKLKDAYRKKKVNFSGYIFTYADSRVERPQQFLKYIDLLEESGIDEVPIRRYGNDEDFQTTFKMTVSGEIQKAIRTWDSDYFVILAGEEVLQEIGDDLYSDNVIVIGDLEKENPMKENLHFINIRSRKSNLFRIFLSNSEESPS